MEPCSVGFAVDTLMDCYLNLCDARGLDEWLLELKTARAAQTDPLLCRALQVLSIYVYRESL